MARFRGTVRGGRGEASRLGSAKSGMTVRLDGWHSGVRVDAGVEDEGDYFIVTATTGSSGGGGAFRLGEVRLRDGRLTFEPSGFVEKAGGGPVNVPVREFECEHGAVPGFCTTSKCGNAIGEEGGKR